MNKKIFFIISLFILIVNLFTGCSKKSEEGKGSYTYRTAISAPSTWSPTDWKTAGEGFILARTVMGLYDFALNSTKDGYEVVCELAEKFPEDVTKEYKGNKIYGVSQIANNGQAWRVKLIENACWDDGTKIDAHDVEYSIRQYLNPKMKNYRASNFYEGPFALANAQDYYDGILEDWNKVGIEVNDDYTVTFILTKPITEFFAYYSMTDIFLIKEDLYEANKKQTGDIIKSAYGTTLENSASYGPYKIVSFQSDKYIKLEKNPMWYGWTDGRHEGQFQTTGYDVQFITDHNTVLNLFLQGNLDTVGLNIVDLQRFGNSDYRVNTPESYTWRFSFNSDKKTLKQEESEGINHSLLAYTDFRHAIALSLDRQKFVDTVSPMHDAGYGLLNYLYIADPENGIKYRETKEAQDVLLSLYGVSSMEDITGYDIKKARALLQKAYDEALASGDIHEGDKVQLDYHTYNTSETNMRMVAFLQDAVNEASKGTALDGQIIVKQITDENYLSNMSAGKVDVAFSAWGGNSYNPYGSLWCYCSTDAVQEYGFNPEIEILTININDKKETLSLSGWYSELCEGKYSNSSLDVRNKILSSCEKAILEKYCAVPVTYGTSASLNSQRIVEGSENFVDDLIKFGGERFRTFTMDDAEWALYCKQNKNQLAY